MSFSLNNEVMRGGNNFYGQILQLQAVRNCSHQLFSIPVLYHLMLGINHM